MMLRTVLFVTRRAKI